MPETLPLEEPVRKKGRYSWHNTNLNGKILGYHLARMDHRARKLLKEIASDHLTIKQRAALEMKYDFMLGRIAFVSNSLVAVQKQRLVEREFDEWVKALDDAKKSGLNPALLAEPPAAPQA